MVICHSFFVFDSYLCIRIEAECSFGVNKKVMEGKSFLIDTFFKSGFIYYCVKIRIKSVKITIKGIIQMLIFVLLQVIIRS